MARQDGASAQASGPGYAVNQELPAFHGLSQVPARTRNINWLMSRIRPAELLQLEAEAYEVLAAGVVVDRGTVGVRIHPLVVVFVGEIQAFKG